MHHILKTSGTSSHHCVRRDMSLQADFLPMTHVPKTFEFIWEVVPVGASYTLEALSSENVQNLLDMSNIVHINLNFAGIHMTYFIADSAQNVFHANKPFSI